ncbi:hypothetical protein [Symbioplanes lichenis]|uniref:hypothetical protein n=1 Tax=Symbioplanes lichenis TaxID=1629072 RepID=UPI0027395543|nr:hypothetical protein [Actinoplanes lichenis]
MDENELRRALRTTMTITPPPMDSAPVVAAGRRAVRRQTAAAALAAAAVVGVTTAVAGAALQPPETPAAGPAPASLSPVPTPTAADTKPVWPLDGDGQPQQDATARSGPRYEQGRKLLRELRAAVPSGWIVAAEPAPQHQAQVGGDKSGSTWEYLASTAIRKNGRSGELIAEVHTPGNALPAGLCATGRAFWSMGGTCRFVTVGDTQVAVVEGGADAQLDQWAAYRHPDGTVVFVAQRDPALTRQQLAALAVREGFHLA